MKSESTFGYTTIRDSYENGATQVDLKIQRGVKTFGNNLIFPKILNDCPEIVSTITKLSYKTGGRIKQNKTAIINVYRNHNQKKAEFSKMLKRANKQDKPE